MSAFTITMLQAITIGIGFGIGYLLSSSSLKLWRAFVGFFAGFALGWYGGVIIWALVFMSSDPYSAIATAMPKSFLFAIIGSGMGVYIRRRKAKLQEQ